MQIDWVLFDADGVLQGTRDGWLAELTAAGGVRGEEFVLAVFEAERRCLTGADFEKAMDEVRAEFGIAAPLSEVFDAAYWIVPDPEMLAAVRRLRAGGRRCALATNQQNLRGAYMRESEAFTALFDEQFYSYQVGAAKPDPAYFRALLERLETPAERVLFIDDNAANVAGAQSVGLSAELFPRDGGVAALAPLLAAYGMVL